MSKSNSSAIRKSTEKTEITEKTEVVESYFHMLGSVCSVISVFSVLSFYAVLINLAFREKPAIGLSGMFIGLRSLVALLRRNFRRFLAPALVHRFQTPFGASPGGSDRLVADEDEDGVGVRRGQDSQGDPTAALQGHVPGQGVGGAVGGYGGGRYGLAVDDHLDGHVAARADAGAF